jgi:protein SCO1/2
MIKIILKMVLGIMCLSAFAQAQSDGRYQRSEHEYPLPDIALVDQNNRTVSLQSLVNETKVILLDFFYTRCKTTCPVLTSDFANFQYRLKPDTGKALLVSITIEPEHDSAALLAQFQGRYKAKPGWLFLTGKEERIERVMRVFSAYTKNRMGYYPLVFLYVPKKQHWIQFEGHVAVEKLIDEYQKAINQ